MTIYFLPLVSVITFIPQETCVPYSLRTPDFCVRTWSQLSSGLLGAVVQRIYNAKRLCIVPNEVLLFSTLLAYDSTIYRDLFVTTILKYI
jgi:hypothetical protein